MAEQNRTGPDWEDVRVFLAVARFGSLSAAARSLGINHATVSRRMRSLEEALGERLVERRPDGYVLTPAGTRILGPASEMEVAAGILSRGGDDDRPKGLVRINAPPSLTQTFLVSRLAKLAIEQPGLDLNLASDVRSVSLERRETDIALRLARPVDGDVYATQLVSLGFGFYGSEACCRRIEEGNEPVFVGFDELNAHLPEAIWLSRHFPKARMSFRTNSQTTQAVAAREGAGLAMLPYFVGKADPDLKLCVLAQRPPARGIWLVTRRQDRRDLPIRVVSDHLRMIFARERDLFERAH
ncbi:LysR family transcriptional regulator [Paroceanicella profunda]|uniref:LysR family transcriptional regulator n=1 Tax=Paroceanicella profunda TaxID=2579971 RepID=A0A5B8FXT0_9RHOB|nr:LysR family transcriptional regulator [Paroceanicella profunda]QDL93325.1 LysR family transcriptional regulator [Paroceanicella profunda]